MAVERERKNMAITRQRQTQTMALERGGKDKARTWQEHTDLDSDKNAPT